MGTGIEISPIPRSLGTKPYQSLSTKSHQSLNTIIHLSQATLENSGHSARNPINSVPATLLDSSLLIHLLNEVWVMTFCWSGAGAEQRNNNIHMSWSAAEQNWNTRGTIP